MTQNISSLSHAVCINIESNRLYIYTRVSVYLLLWVYLLFFKYFDYAWPLLIDRLQIYNSNNWISFGDAESNLMEIKSASNKFTKRFWSSSHFIFRFINFHNVTFCILNVTIKTRATQMLHLIKLIVTYGIFSTRTPTETESNWADHR